MRANLDIYLEDGLSICRLLRERPWLAIADVARHFRTDERIVRSLLRWKVRHLLFRGRAPSINDLLEDWIQLAPFRDPFREDAFCETYAACLGRPTVTTSVVAYS